MPNINGGKILLHADRIIGEHKPITADIFLTNYCNNACPYCTYRRWELEHGARAMKVEQFIAYAERLLSMGVKGIILTGGGEPTLAPDFMAITNWLEGNGVHYGINTNFNNLLFFKPDYLKVSLDGYSEESYEKSRGVRAYSRVRENIIKYAEWKKEHSPNTTLGIQAVVKNEWEMRRFYEANKDLPVDYISFRPVESTGGRYYKELNKHLDYLHPHRIVPAIKELREKDERVVLNFKWELLSQQEDSCTAAWAQMALNEKGQVMYCCHKPYQIVGHILDPDILEKKASAHTDMSMCDIPCRMTSPNMIVRQMVSGGTDANFI